MANSQLNAALAHYRAKQARTISELEIYLNNPTGVGDHVSVTDAIIQLIADLDSANSQVETITNLINTLEDKTTKTDTPSLSDLTTIPMTNTESNSTDSAQP